MKTEMQEITLHHMVLLLSQWWADTNERQSYCRFDARPSSFNTWCNSFFWPKEAWKIWDAGCQLGMILSSSTCPFAGGYWDFCPKRLFSEILLPFKGLWGCGWQMEDGHLFVCSEAGCTVAEGCFSTGALSWWIWPSRPPTKLRLSTLCVEQSLSVTSCNDPMAEQFGKREATGTLQQEEALGS